MSTEKRTVAFLVLAMATMLGMNLLMDRLGWLPKPAPPAKTAEAPKKPALKAEDKGTGKEADTPAVAAKDAPADKPKPDTPELPAAEEPAVKLIQDPKALFLGSVDRANPRGYRIGVQVDQKGGGIAWLGSSVFDAERVQGRPNNLPLRLIEPDAFTPPSFSVSLVPGKDDDPVTRDSYRLDRQVWEVVTDEQGRTVRPLLSEPENGEERQEVGQQLVLRARAGSPPLVVTRTYTLRKGADGLEMELAFANEGAPRKVSYRLDGPHGIPIEGDWYTGTFRDLFVRQLGGDKPDTKTAYDIAKATKKYNDARESAEDEDDVKAEDYLEHYQSLPLQYAGVENQYFAVFFEPFPTPTKPEDRWDRQTVPVVLNEAKDLQKSDISVVMTSKPIEVGPNVPVAHRYRIFAGPKTFAALEPYGATDLATYRKGWQLPVLGWLGARVSQNVIAPLLTRIYSITEYVASLLGGHRGNYGVAIILLVITVRLCLFPLSRKQALMAKRMQDLQPLLAELKEKHKDDKERLVKEQFALQRKHGVNMFGGCLPALIQIPIFIGLWQALNNSVALRHEPFILWIRDLSAPDMLFKFPFEIPLIGGFLGPYFNVLPLISAGLMLVHTKLFAPPATTPEAEMQQKMMKYMMVFMAVMLYRVPSGLGIYFITSSSWAICERLLLPKTLKKRPVVLDEDEAGGDGGKGGPDGKRKPGGGGWMERMMNQLEQLKEEASKDATIRNNKADGRERPRETTDRNAPRPRPRSKPGKRR